MATTQLPEREVRRSRTRLPLEGMDRTRSQDRGGTASTKQARVNSAVIETRMLTASKIDWPGSGRKGSRSSRLVGEELLGLLAAGDDPVVDPLGPLPQLGLAVDVAAPEPERHAEVERLQRVGAGQRLGLVGLLVEPIGAEPLLVDVPLQDVLPPLRGVRPAAS